jgi:type 1 glutamine amidotransferase
MAKSVQNELFHSAAPTKSSAQGMKALLKISFPWLLILCLVPPGLVASGRSAEPTARPRKVILISGPLDASHPRGTHEYEKSVQLLQQCLDSAPELKGLKTETHTNGWPRNPATLNDADTLVLITSGSDRKAEDHPLLVGDHADVMARQMQRGCGLVMIHWTTFAPTGAVGDKVLEWTGGYFDYQSGTDHPQHWLSRIQHVTTTARPGTPDHPICRGLEPFQVRDEFYYRIRFRENDPRLKPILRVTMPGESADQIVAWAVERKDGGRGFGFTGGHYFENWQLENFRRMILNAIVWTARAEVPVGGVQSTAPPMPKPEARDTK